VHLALVDQADQAVVEVLVVQVAQELLVKEMQESQMVLLHMAQEVAAERVLLE
jgi:hypothetical protein